MTRDEIAQAMHDTAGSDWGAEAHFQKFAALVAAAEREECAKVCEEGGLLWGQKYAAAIRARGET